MSEWSLTGCVRASPASVTTSKTSDSFPTPMRRPTPTIRVSRQSSTSISTHVRICDCLSVEYPVDDQWVHKMGVVHVRVNIHVVRVNIQFHSRTSHSLRSRRRRRVIR